MIGNVIFYIIYTLGIIFSALCLLGGIIENFPIISSILFILILCLWIPKFNKPIIKQKFKSYRFLYVICAFILSFILMATSIHIGTQNNIKDNLNNIQQNSQTEQSPETETHSKYSQSEKLSFAQLQCTKDIKSRFNYPPSVKVNFRQDNYINENSYTLYGTVDSQNAFGAMVRQNFACEVIIDEENDKYWVNDVNIE